MTDLKNIERIYFIGIGGIGMSALARYFAFHGKQVSGYDKTSTVLTRELEAEGIVIVYKDDESFAPRDAQLVVYTPAVPPTHPQLEYYRNNRYEIVKRSDVLGAITKASFNICIAGTHGKTTISTMVAHILRHTGYGCNAFLGGIAANYNSNFWSSENNTCVIEADEYDRSFLKLSPDIAVISAMDADHLDIYGTEKAMQDAFVEFGSKVKPGGKLFAKKGLPRERDLAKEKTVNYSITSAEAAVYGSEIKITDGHYRFKVKAPQGDLNDVVLNMGGMHNVENATVAIGIAKQLKIADEAIRAAVEAFRGVKRRFEYIVKTKEQVYIDDYAHHPEELTALLGSVKKLFPEKRATVIFQPHLFSRTRDFAAGFSASLDIADEVWLLPIYPARELPIAGITSEMLAGGIRNAKVVLMTKEEVTGFVKKRIAENNLPVLVTAGAGDIDTLVQPIKTLMTA